MHLSSAVLVLPPFFSDDLRTILGTVRKPTGAVVPRAIVVLANIGTRAKRSTVANDVGTYSAET